ncbi:MAG TPA: small, acid-soluble spore protein, alpha/beta type [Syntrophomonadaceae bacterium]|nr:small, acid-soluble spore protein, alpha/beta type [Syntrophomonadaceae bacterium]
MPDPKKHAKKKKGRAVPSERERLKMEIAKELGIWEQVEKEGWKSLSNAACGRVGGIMRKRLKEIEKQK